MQTVHPPATFLELALRLALAVACGMALGLNRELHHKPAGLRTHALVALGSALFTLIALSGSPADFVGASRVIQGIVAGIGFIGGGVILHRDDPRGVHGLPTAASIWIGSAIGIATGAGLWHAALLALALTLFTLSVGGRIDARIREQLQRKKTGVAGVVTSAPIDDD
jgi:putative Mg2+ transporter-C (MgtC) family protein